MIALARHHKTGTDYRLVGHAVDCTNARNGTPVVVYCNTKGDLFVREAHEFFEKFTTIDEESSTHDWPDALEVG